MRRFIISKIQFIRVSVLLLFMVPSSTHASAPQELLYPISNNDNENSRLEKITKSRTEQSTTPITNLQQNCFIHRIGVEVRPAWVIPTNAFLKGGGQAWKPIKQSLSAHLNYSFRFPQNSTIDRIYSGVYQGFGAAYYSFNDQRQLGDPIAFYLLQGARIARIAPNVSLNYEWNFGLSIGWKPYNYETNPNNTTMGSKINAYINTNFYLNWALSPLFDLTSGVTFAHFSNGNTKLPNAGLNKVGLKVGLTCNFNRQRNPASQPEQTLLIPPFARHISYDLMVFGSWRRKGIILEDLKLTSPESYSVIGFNFTPMYNISRKFRCGISFDGVFDESTDIYSEDFIVGSSPEFFKKPWYKQLALGISGRAEFVMPYFTIGIGMGSNVLYQGKDHKGFYQVISLKVATTRNSFLHIGYNLHNFETPNYLMLGIGYRFNNKSISLRR